MIHQFTDAVLDSDTVELEVREMTAPKGWRFLVNGSEVSRERFQLYWRVMRSDMRKAAYPDEA